MYRKNNQRDGWHLEILLLVIFIANKEMYIPIIIITVSVAHIHKSHTRKLTHTHTHTYTHTHTHPNPIHIHHKTPFSQDMNVYNSSAAEPGADVCNGQGSHTHSTTLGIPQNII